MKILTVTESASLLSKAPSKALDVFLKLYPIGSTLNTKSLAPNGCAWKTRQRAQTMIDTYKRRGIIKKISHKGQTPVYEVVSDQWAIST